jgi:hypothetical protein
MSAEAKKKNRTRLTIIWAVLLVLLWNYHEYVSPKPKHEPDWAYAVKESEHPNTYRSLKAGVCAADKESAEAWSAALSRDDGPARGALLRAGKVQPFQVGLRYRAASTGAFWATIETTTGAQCVVPAEYVTKSE